MITCPLCNEEVTEFKTNSHVLPEWMYKPFYEHEMKDRIFYLSNADDGIVHRPRKGFRRDFVCEKCENLFSNDDNYASKVLTDNDLQSKERRSIIKKNYLFQSAQFNKNAFVGLV